MRRSFLLFLFAVACKDGAELPSDDSGGDDSAPVEMDEDQDGFSAEEDCDDGDPAVNPGADEEPYNGVDDDCDASTADDDLDGDGFAQADDCDDADPAVNPDATEEAYNGVDDDCDAFTADDDLDADGFLVSEDCDDLDAAVFPGAEEQTYNGVDDDCDPATADDDLDGDGFVLADDCDDANAAVNPGAEEVCGGVDEDCSGAEDDGAVDAPAWYSDVDGDGYGDASTSVLACEAPSGLIADGTDCDDTDPAFHPDAPETDCTDPNDYNCDGSTGYDDVDGDGWVACEECDDSLSTVNPDAAEVCDGDDNDCDTLIDDADDSLDATTTSPWYTDADADGYGDASTEVFACEGPAGSVSDGTDCDDLEAARNPGATEVCDDLDNDCDALADDADSSLDTSTATSWYADADLDGFGAGSATLACDAPSGSVADGSDCDDGSAAVNPDAVEVCDGIDDDCDAAVDDADPDLDLSTTTTWYSDGDGDGYGAGVGVAACEAPSGTVDLDGDCDDGNFDINPAATEVCDSVDNDCDSLIDDADDSVDPSVGGGTWYTDSDGDGYGDPGAPQDACLQPGGTVTDFSDCDDVDAAINPAATEICDGADNDCDGTTDDDDTSLDLTTATTWYGDSDGDGYGVPGTTTTTCLMPSGYAVTDDDCDDGDAVVYPWAGDTLGDGVDGDCDGMDCEASISGSGKTYLVYCEGPLDWTAAATTCVSAGHDGLASIRSGSEQNTAESLLSSAGASDAPWIGFTDSATEGTWVWSDGWGGGYKNWGKSEPAGGASEDCAVFNADGKGNWADEVCTDTASFICGTRF